MVYFLILLAITLRFIIDIPNFAPITAIAIFGAVYLPKRWALIVPLAAMLISDYFIGFYHWPILLSVYASFAVSVLLGLFLRRRKTAANTVGVTLIASIQFYLLTNFAVWAFGTMYPHSVFGLLNSYINALPFFRWTLISDLFYVGALFGIYELARYWLGAPGSENSVWKKVS